MTLLLGVFGWTPTFNGTFHSFAYVLFRTLGNLVPSVWNLEGGNLLTDIAAATGLLAFYSSLAVIGAALLAEGWRKLSAQLLYKDHVLVLGNTRWANRAAEIWRRHGRLTLQVCGDDRDSRAPRAGMIRHPLDTSIVDKLGLKRARNVFLDLGDDIPTLALGLELMTAMEQTAQRGKRSLPEVEWVIVVQDRGLADHFALKVGELRARRPARVLPHIHYLYPDDLTARTLLAEHPLFLQASQNGQNRIHALILCYGTIGAHLIDGIFLTSFVTCQDSPRVTVLSARPDEDRIAFFEGRPSLTDLIDVVFLDMGVLHDFEVPSTEQAKILRGRVESAPVTATFLISEDANENLRLAISIKRLQRRTGRLDCSLFSWNGEDRTHGKGKTSEAFGQAIQGYCAFGLTDDLYEAQLCDPRQRDRLAKALHAKYLATTGRDAPSWDDLPESLRRANCNAADHGLAKLFSFGVDISTVPAGSVPRISRLEGQRLLASSAPGRPANSVLSDVVRLEHERWTIERRLDGWTYAKTYDPARQTHPLLLSWDSLREHHPDEVEKNRKQIEALVECLVEMTEGETALQLEAAQTSGVRHHAS